MTGKGEQSLRKNTSINSQTHFLVFAIFSCRPTLAKSLSIANIHSLPKKEVPSSSSINYTQTTK